MESRHYPKNAPMLPVNLEYMKFYLLILLSVLFTNFFGATDINNTILLLSLLPFVILELPKKGLFKWFIILLILCFCVNIVSCYVYNEQSIYDSIKASAPFYYILFYFALKNFDISICKTETALLCIVLIFCICYLIQYAVYPIKIFSGADVDYVGDVRIRLNGQGFASLGFFYSLNKFLKEKKVQHLLLLIMCFVVIFLMGFRTMLAAIVLVSYLFFIRINGIKWNIVIYTCVAVILIFLVLHIPIFAEKIESMQSRQETDTFSNPNYIRLVEYLHFTKYHFKNNYEYFFGSGLAFGNSNYRDYMSKLAMDQIWWVDWGLLGLSWMVGIPTVIFMLLYSIKAIFTKVSSEYYYLGTWFIYLLLISITTQEFYRPGNFVVQAVALYLIDKAKQNMEKERIYVSTKY